MAGRSFLARLAARSKPPSSDDIAPASIVACTVAANSGPCGAAPAALAPSVAPAVAAATATKSAFLGDLGDCEAAGPDALRGGGGKIEQVAPLSPEWSVASAAE
ncbi:hypothetical protein Vretimale_4857 [Volvox reticuliferus]|uniref:Uncharacterized protein n=1 Tax=Volvox reticuliferus TaxID=1737510 RepID=A0A8J4DEM6_9CHLO|nr:hypothetical protein Vretimale_4857 [Volvox reticuliferus]